MSNAQAVSVGEAAAVVGSLRRDEVPQFVRRSIENQTLSSLMKELNAGVLCDDPQRRAAATRALKRLGFL